MGATNLALEQIPRVRTLHIRLVCRPGADLVPVQAKFIQALAAKGLETIRLTEALSVDSESSDNRGALAEHLEELRQNAAELGFVHLEASVRATQGQLVEESFSSTSVLAARALAWRYEELARMPSQSGTHAVVSDVVIPEAPPEVIENDPDRESEELRDPLERENFRAQWGVSMHREPANRVSRPSEMIWRRKVETRPVDDELRSGFGLEMRLAPKVMGFGFAAVFCVTVGFLVWRQGLRGSEQVYTDAVPTLEEAQPATGADAARLLAVSDVQGVLQLIGPASVAVHIDGVDQGPLPVTLVLDEGRHVVRYGVEEAWTYRFYYVKAGATRVLQVSPTQGGFVDAR